MIGASDSLSDRVRSASHARLRHNGDNAASRGEDVTVAQLIVVAVGRAARAARLSASLCRRAHTPSLSRVPPGRAARTRGRGAAWGRGASVGPARAGPGVAGRVRAWGVPADSPVTPVTGARSPAPHANGEPAAGPAELPPARARRRPSRRRPGAGRRWAAGQVAPLQRSPATPAATLRRPASSCGAAAALQSDDLQYVGITCVAVVALRRDCVTLFRDSEYDASVRRAPIRGASLAPRDCR